MGDLMVPWGALVASYVFVGAVVLLGEGVRRAGASVWVARKVIHVGTGFWVFMALRFFPDWRWAVVPPLTAVAGNWIIRRFRLVPAMVETKGAYGTIYFPLAVAVLMAGLWHLNPAGITCGVAAMAAGDPAAAWAGRRWPWGPYRRGRKHLSGTAAMFATAWLGLAATLMLWHGLPPTAALQSATVLAAAAALLEAVGRQGSDNLLVPLGVGLLALLLVGGPMTAAAGPLAAAVGLGLLVSVIGYWRGALAGSGLLAATAVGAAVFGLGGWGPGLALVAFFVSASVLTHSFARPKAAAEQRYAKGGRRDCGQVLANGGVAALLAAAGQPLAALGAIAAACADTWATEVGPLSPRPPRLLSSGRVVPAGTSGAVSLLGVLAALAGALAMGGFALLVPGAGVGAVFSVAAGGVAGNLADSLLGATLQAQYRCPCCGQVGERSSHCGARAARISGWAWLGNDGTNLAATAVGAAVAAWLALLTGVA